MQRKTQMDKKKDERNFTASHNKINLHFKILTAFQRQKKFVANSRYARPKRWVRLAALKKKGILPNSKGFRIFAKEKSKLTKKTGGAASLRPLAKYSLQALALRGQP